VLIRGVVGHKIEDETNAALMKHLKQSIEIPHRAEEWIDIAKIRDVVAKVSHGRTKNRRQPYGADSQPIQMVDPAYQAGKVPFAIAVRILK